jgi:BASS family bile acid:Na+ symporter
MNLKFPAKFIFLFFLIHFSQQEDIITIFAGTLTYFYKMNTIWIVMPILIVLMFLLGTELNGKAFENVIHSPRAVILGMVGQIILLPLIAFLIAWSLKLPATYFMGIMLIACCPGGSSSNIFSMLAKGDIALSVTLTALSSVITLFTLPIIMEFVTQFISHQSGTDIELPIGKLLVQNIALLFVPLICGIVFRHFSPSKSAKVNKILSKGAFPALMILASTFFLQYPREIMDNIATLGTACTLLLLISMVCSQGLSRIGRLSPSAGRTIVIEVGMQNAAQAIAIASSPFIFNSGEMAIPAIIYALIMNVILLIYVFKFRYA